MREIKFRAWDKVDKMMDTVVEMHYGTDNKLCWIAIPRQMTEDEWQLEQREVDDKDIILMQFTGLLDRNGKEIYEGDIIKSLKNCMFDEGYEVADVLFQGGAFKYRSVNLKTVVDGFKAEVIGNIYENPELLEAK